MTQVNPKLTLDIEGRIFIQEDPTFEQEMYIMEQAKLTGLMDIGDLRAALQSDNPNREIEKIIPAVRDMIVRGYQSGRLFHLMAALMTEDGTEWTPESAEANAKFFAKVRDPDSKRRLQPALAASVMAFFESAATFDATSLISFDETEPVHGVIVKRKPLSPEQAAAAFRSGTLKSPSANSPSTIELTSVSSSVGRSAKGSLPSKRSGASKRGRNTRKSR